MINTNERLTWLKEKIGHHAAILGVSGGLDSAVCLAMLGKILPPEKIYPVLLPVGSQDMNDAKQIITDFNLSARATTIDISPLVDAAKVTLQLDNDFHETLSRVRLGNIMARARMICLYDLAKKVGGIVCGTSNKSEVYLGYFTLWGDGAEDIAPLYDLTKTQVRAVAKQLGVPSHFIDKAPSANLWENQSDETELGFTYELADQVIEKLEHGDTNFSDTEQPVLARIAAVKYKTQVPYHL
jgi:NAD+ synthase